MSAKNSKTQKIAFEYRATLIVIQTFIKALCPQMSQEHVEHNASALIARLAQHDPPILLEFMTEDAVTDKLVKDAKKILKDVSNLNEHPHFGRVAKHILELYD